MKRSLDNSWRALLILAEVIVLIAMPYLGAIPDYGSWIENAVIIALIVVIVGLLIVGAIMLVVHIINSMMDEYCRSEKAEDKFLIVVSIIIIVIGVILYT